MKHKIAVIAGDGIGHETVPEGLRALDAAARRFSIDLTFEHHDFASCDYYAKHGDDDAAPTGKHGCEGTDAIFFGACGWPATVPDHVSLWGSLIKFRREFDQYVNLRPCKLMPGIRSPLVDRNGTPVAAGGDRFRRGARKHRRRILVDRGRMFEGTEREFVVQETVMTRHGVDRVLRFAFELAGKRPKKHLTSATKSNGISITMPYWDERVEADGEAVSRGPRSTNSTSIS